MGISARASQRMTMVALGSLLSLAGEFVTSGFAQGQSIDVNGAASPVREVLGFRVGMTISDARSALGAHRPPLAEQQPSIQLGVPGLDAKFTPQIFATATGAN